MRHPDRTTHATAAAAAEAITTQQEAARKGMCCRRLHPQLPRSRATARIQPHLCPAAWPWCMAHPEVRQPAAHHDQDQSTGQGHNIPAKTHTNLQTHRVNSRENERRPTTPASQGEWEWRRTTPGSHCDTQQPSDDRTAASQANNAPLPHAAQPLSLPTVAAAHEPRPWVHMKRRRHSHGIRHASTLTHPQQPQ